jgi:hypothetical protein
MPPLPLVELSNLQNELVHVGLLFPSSKQYLNYHNKLILCEYYIFTLVHALDYSFRILIVDVVNFLYNICHLSYLFIFRKITYFITKEI